MKAHKSSTAGAALLAVFACSLLQAAPGHSLVGADTRGAVADSSGVAAQYAALPIRFEPNVGQSDRHVQFLTRASGYTLFLTATESVMVFGGPAIRSTRERPDATAALTSAQTANGPSVLRIGFVGANPQVMPMRPRVALALRLVT